MTCPPPVFVINLADATSRLDRIAGALEGAGLAFRRIEAIDGRGRRATDFAAYDIALGRRAYGRVISGPEAACFLSHRAAAQAVLDSGAPSVLVLEDDANPPADLPDFLHELQAWLHHERTRDWDVAQLCGPVTGPHSPLPLLPGRLRAAGLGVAHAFVLSMAALLWTRGGAARFLAASARIYAPVDQFLADVHAPQSRALGCLHPPVGLTGAPSTIRHGLWQKVLDTRSPLALLTKARRLRRNTRAALADQQSLAARQGARAGGQD